MEITITLDSQTDEISLSLATKAVQDVKFSPVSDKITLDVFDFPNYKNIFPKTIFVPVQNYISIRAVAAALIPDIDPDIIASMDDIPLEVLDIKKDIQIKNIN